MRDSAQGTDDLGDESVENRPAPPRRGELIAAALKKFLAEDIEALLVDKVAREPADAAEIDALPEAKSHQE